MGPRRARSAPGRGADEQSSYSNRLCSENGREDVLTSGLGAEFRPCQVPAPRPWTGTCSLGSVQSLPCRTLEMLLASRSHRAHRSLWVKT